MLSRPGRAFLLLLSMTAAAAVAVSSPREAAAQQPDAATRQAARKVAEEGLKLFNDGDFTGALEKFNLADSLVPAPTLDVQAARCLVKLGRLVEASERYLEAMRAQLDKNAPVVHKKAQVDALKERDELVIRIPTVEIRVEGPLGEGKVTIDGQDVPVALLGQKRPIDPGKHTLVAKRQDTSVTREVTVGEKETALAVLKLPPLPPPPVVAPVKPPGEGMRVAGRIALGVGAGGLIAFGVNGAVALSLQGKLRESCEGGACGPADHGRVDSFNLVTTASTIGMIVGIAGAGAGVTLLLLAPSGAPKPRDEKAALPPPAVWIGPGSAGLKGVF
jgi:hypothetical protein